MGRLQDFPSVTPTSSDKILIVQSQGQGLAPHTIKMDSSNPTGTGALSINRKANTTTGTNSVTEGRNGTASGNFSHAEGDNNTASGTQAHAEGYNNTASGASSHAEGSTNTASGAASHVDGYGNTAKHLGQHVFGAYNDPDTSTAQPNQRGNYIEIVGKGTNDANRSNARTLDWSGNEVLAGDCTIKGNISLYDTITPSLASLTYTQGVSYVSGGVYQVGKIIIVALRITIDANIGSTGSDIISGFPRPARTGTYSSPYVRFSTINGSFAVYDTGILKGYSATAGTVLINGVYIAE